MTPSISDRSSAAVLAAALLSLAAGCGPDIPPNGEVFGRVTVAGRPLTGGVLMLAREMDSRPVKCLVGPDGGYLATGLPPGQYGVAVDTSDFKNQAEPPAGLRGGYTGPKFTYTPVPEKYQKIATSGLRVEVVRGRSEYPINLE